MAVLEHEEPEEGECTPTKTETPPAVTEEENSSSLPKVKRIRLSFNRKFTGCVPASEFSIKEKVGEGTFGEVYRAVHLKSGKEVALKKVLNRVEQEGFPITAIREIKLLKNLHHANVIDLQEMVFEQEQVTGSISSIYMSFSYMEHDLTGLLQDKSIRFSIPQIKCYMSQMLNGLRYLHEHHILHRDIKGSNVLLNNRGELRVTDFGLSRPMEEGRREYTPGVFSRWYRPPELLLGTREYDTSADMWGMGCILAEMFLKRPLFPGEDDFSQLETIAKLCGTPSSETIPNMSSYPLASKVHIPVYKRKLREMGEIGDVLARDLIDKLLVLDAKKRLSAKAALEHSFFTTSPLPALPQSLPTYSSRHEYTDQKESQAHAPHPTPQEHAAIPPITSAGRLEDPWKPSPLSAPVVDSSDKRPSSNIVPVSATVTAAGDGANEKGASVVEERRNSRDSNREGTSSTYRGVRRHSRDYYYDSQQQQQHYYPRDDPHHYSRSSRREAPTRGDYYSQPRDHDRRADCYQRSDLRREERDGEYGRSRSPSGRRQHSSRYDSGYRRKQTDYRDL